MAAVVPDRLIFIRHGETDWNREGRLQGQREVPLNHKGREQAAAVGRQLKTVVDAAVDDNFYASPLRRARETMEIARAAAGLLPVEAFAVDDRLREMTFGRWEGCTWREVAARDPEGAAARKRDKWGFVPPGGESYAMLAERVKPWLARVQGLTIVVAHGGVARVLMTLLTPMEPVEAAGYPIVQGRLLLFSGGSHRWI